MESFSSRVVKLLLRLMRYNQPYKTKHIDPIKIRKDDIAKPNRWMCKGCEVTFKTPEKFKIWYIKPHKASGDTILFYLHGGAFVGGMVRQQWNTIAKIGRLTSKQIIIPDYPLAPENSHRDTIEMVAETYTEILETTSSKNITFIGDSAGGGLMFSFAMQLQAEGKSMPSKLIALSPWVDATMTNPESKSLEPLDLMTAVAGLKRAGELYARGTNPSNYLISPLYGKMKGLPPMYIFAGTHDILQPDEKLFAEKAIAEGVDTHYYEYPKMIHGWMFLPIPEAKQAINKIVDICKD